MLSIFISKQKSRVNTVQDLSNIKWWFLGITSLCTVISSNVVSAQIVPDNTLPNNSEVKVEGNINKIEGGTTAGDNLFHSFEKFGIPTGSEAHFNNAVDISNIITRVTGKSISEIDGLIKANGAANLFLINPNGIVFGNNARLDIGGSFVGSTADSIKFGDDVEFSAKNPQQTPLLTMNVPMGLQYGSNPGNIQVKGDGEGIKESSEIPDTQNGLQVKPNQTLALVGGDINLEGASLKTYVGKVELGSVAAPGLVNIAPVEKGFSFNYDNVDGGNIELSQRAVVDADDIQVWGRNIKITDGSVIGTMNFGSEDVGSLVVNGQESVQMIGNSDGQLTGLFTAVSSQATRKGADITIKTDNLLVKDGAEVGSNTFGEGNGGNLNIDAKNIQLSGTTKDGQFSSGFFASSRQNSTGDAGDINIKTDNLLVKDRAQINTKTFGQGKSGNLNIDAQDVIISDSSFLFTSSEENSTGDAGDITIKTNNLLVKDEANISTGTSGQGKGGNLSINAKDVQLTGDSSLLAFSGENSTGDAGDITIQTNTFLAKDGVIIGSSTFGKGKGGDITIKTNSLLAKDRVIINANTSGEGNGGNLNVDAQDVQITTGSSLFTSSGENSTGDVGNLIIKTNNLLVKDGADVSLFISEKGNGGNLIINAQDVQLIGSLSGLSILERENSTGNTGDITIKTNSLLVKDGARISNTNAGKGNDGNLSIDAQNVQLIGSLSSLLTFTFPNSTGDAGNITIKTNNLLVKDGAGIDTTTSGEGNGGNLSIEAQDVQLIGTSKNDSFLSSLSTLTASTGDAGDITIKTNSLLIKDGASVMTDTMAEGKGGNLTVDAQDVQLIGESFNGQFSSSLSSDAVLNSTGDAGDLTIRTNNLLVKDGAQINVGTFGEGKSGNLTVDAKNVQLIGKTGDNQFSSGLFTSAAKNSTGDAGDLTINSDILQVEDGAKVDVEGRSTGRAGNLTINADSIRLNNDALLSANTRNNNNSDTEQATINIKSQELIMRRGSNIFTNATGENVIGGNININTDFLIANENSDISANSENSQGGQVRIDAQAIFGTQFRSQPTSKSDITATGASEDLSGTVEIITPQTDPTSGSIEFPTTPVDTEIADACSTPGYANSSFTITGKGSLPPSPFKPLTGRLNRTKLATLEGKIDPQATRRRQKKKVSPKIKQIIEARGWVRTPDGRIILVAHAPNNTNSQAITNSANCKFAESTNNS